MSVTELAAENRRNAGASLRGKTVEQLQRLVSNGSGRLRYAAQRELDSRPALEVLDDSLRNQLPTGYVTVTAPDGATDAELADAAGYSSSQFGYTVTRHQDHTATVALWND